MNVSICETDIFTGGVYDMDNQMTGMTELNQDQMANIVGGQNPDPSDRNCAHHWIYERTEDYGLYKLRFYRCSNCKRSKMEKTA